jgi:uncharacterized membrane-anchored protein YitT (DUF2179 family)
MEKKTPGIILPLLQIIVGALLYAIGFRYFTYPNDIVPGGVSGIAMIINYLTDLPVGVLIIVMNIPLFLLSWKRFGLRFLLLSLFATLLSSAAMDVLAAFPLEITHEPLLAAVYGGIIKGVGFGLIYRAGGTTGGTDFVAKFLRLRYPYIHLSTFLLGLDVAVIAAFAVIFRKYDSAMYAILCMFIVSRVIDLMLYGAVNSKVCYIITDESRAVKNAIMETLNRGVTFLHGRGAWSGEEKDVILCVIKPQQIVDLKRLVKKIDERAFLIVSDAREVFGKGFAYFGDED